MSVAVIQEWLGGGHDTTNYDEVKRRMGVQDDPPAGLIVHTAGTDGEDFRIVDVWETPEAWETFRDERLLPTVREVVSELPSARQAAARPPDVRVYDLHDLVLPETRLLRG
jgi:hypothetical protein